DAKLDLHLAKSSSLWQLSGIEPAPRGAVSLQLDLAGSLPSLEQFSGAPHAALEALLEQGVTGQMALKSDEVTLPGWSDGVTANLAGEVTVAEEAASLILSAPANITIPKIDEERLRDFGLDPAWLEGGLALDLAEGGRIAAERSGATAELAGKLAAGKTRSLAFDGKFGGNRDMIDIDDLAITAESGPLAGTPLERLELAGHLSGRLSPGQSGDGPQGLALPFHELSLSLTKLAAALNEGLPEPLSLAVPEVTLSSRLSAEQPFAAKLALTKGTVNLPGRALELNGLALTADLDSSGLAAPMTLAGQAIDKQAEPLFNPLGFKAEVVQTKQSYALNGEVYLPKGAGPLRVAGHYGLDSRKGELALDLDSLSFIKSLVQPVDLSPRLALLSDVSGSASMTAEITLDGDTRRGTALIGLNGMGFTLNDVKFEDLNLSLALNELEPPASPPDQDLTARAIDPGVPIEDLAARYQLLPGDPAKIKIEEATFRAAGGRFRLADTLIDPAAETNRVVLEVVGLDLADLLKDYPVDGLTVTGLMTGVVPVTLSGDQLAIEDANLEAQGPGLLQFRSDSANQALASGGDPVALMLEALEDFQYETLDISAFKDAEHNTQMLIEILGNNPNVLDGYPFKFNINLSGNMGPIVSALTRGYEISNDLIRRSWKLSP
ncbi:MAG: YdbH domain-containing protein, partial [Pseudomonadota bacterium]